MSPRHSLRLNATLPLLVMKEKEKYVAYTPALELASSGKTPALAQQNFKEALDLFFEELLEHGSLDQALRDLGWQKSDEHWEPPVEVTKVTRVAFEKRRRRQHPRRQPRCRLPSV